MLPAFLEEEMNLDPTTVQILVTLGSFLVLGTVYIVNGRAVGKALTQRLDLIDDTNDRRFAEIDNQVRDLRTEMRRLSEVLIKLTEAEGRMNLLDERVLAQGKRVDSLASSFRDLLMDKVKPSVS